MNKRAAFRVLHILASVVKRFVTNVSFSSNVNPHYLRLPLNYYKHECSAITSVAE